MASRCEFPRACRRRAEAQDRSQPLLPWKMLADQGFGLWCDPPYAEPPPAFDATAALRALGYDTGNREAAVRAFNLHFLPDEAPAALTERSRGLLYCLYQKAAG